jgi:hypothetical protein
MPQADPYAPPREAASNQIDVDRKATNNRWLTWVWVLAWIWAVINTLVAGLFLVLSLSPTIDAARKDAEQDFAGTCLGRGTGPLVVVAVMRFVRRRNNAADPDKAPD